MRTVKQWFIDWIKLEVFSTLLSLLVVLSMVIVAMLEVYYFPENDLYFTGCYILFHVVLCVYLIIKAR